jgi:DNA helicase HerA-like ATPase
VVRRGAILGSLGDDGDVQFGTVTPFVGASIEAVDREVWAALERKRGADMAVGTSRAGRALLAGSSFNRHTFLCGQSGSGKSYALGVLLEQLLIDTDLPLLVLDPNGDFVGLGSTLEGVDAHDAERLAAAHVTTYGAIARPGAQLLRVRFTELSIEAKAAVLQLEPLADRREYNVLLSLEQQLATEPVEVVMQRLMESEGSDERILAQRIENLGILGWDVWAREDDAFLEMLDPTVRANVLDIGGFGHPRERLSVALALLDHLWENRERRQPVLLVIDEAHNVCLADPIDPLARATTERLIQVANEGRKYGIWMLLCTQRPSRIHQAVLAQCDNLVLMRMNSPGDLHELEQLFGFVPPEMLRVAPMFRQGECLMAGAFAPVPSFVQMRRRRTAEGGGDVRVPTPG